MTKTTRLSWRRIEKLVEKLAAEIKASNFEPDYLVGIATGGLIPLALLAKELSTNNVTTITAASYRKTKRGKLRITNLPHVNLNGKKVLLVDEVAETGETLKQISKILIACCKVGSLKTAVLTIHGRKCRFHPDFFVLDERSWVVFPWERKEFPEYCK